MKKIDAIKKIREFVNHYDGGNIQHYVAEHLVNFLVDELRMLPPHVEHSVKAYRCVWEDEDEKK